jgi:hypothetical protein
MGCSAGHSRATLGGDQRLIAVTYGQAAPRLFHDEGKGADYFQAGHSRSIG